MARDHPMTKDPTTTGGEDCMANRPGVSRLAAQRLRERAGTLRTDYLAAKLFPHLVIDDLFVGNRGQTPIF